MAVSMIPSTKNLLQKFDITPHFTQDGQEIELQFGTTYPFVPIPVIYVSTGTTNRANMPIVTVWRINQTYITIRLFSLGGGTPDGTPNIIIDLMKP